jgi:hypothetical protein
MPSVQQMIQVGLDVLGTTVDAAAKIIRANIGDVTHEDSEFDAAEWWQHVGFASRPRKPEPGKQSAQVVTVRRSDFDACISSRDVRDGAVFSDLNHGETAIYAMGGDGAGTARVFLRADNTIEIKNVNASITVKPSGEIVIKNATGNVTLDASGKVALGLAAPQFGVVNELGFNAFLAASKTLTAAIGTFAGSPLLAALSAGTGPALVAACGAYTAAIAAATPFVSTTVTSSP